ncbi:MAG: glycosyltransferase [Desulfobacteraceae bacterium]|nr:glycosyltransferase [Desulfobacteraceae bacterium]
MTRPRIMHIITGLSTGGAERALYNLIKGGLGSKFDTAVISLSDMGVFGPRIRALVVPVYALNLKTPSSLPLAMMRLWRIVRKFRPDLVQGWMYHGNLAATMISRFFAHQAPVAWNIRHSLYSLEYEKPATRHVIHGNRMISRWANKIIYNSRLSRRQHVSLGLCDRRGLVIPNGFDLHYWKPDDNARLAVRSSLGINQGALVVGNIARYHPMKDHILLLEAAKQVLKKRSDVVFLLAGRQVVDSNPDFQPLLAQLPSKRLMLLGERADIKKYLSAMDILCLSSAWGEAFPNVLGEAMACGVPCVTTDVGDSRYIVSKTGLVVPPKNKNALAEALLNFLDKSRTERTALAIAARQRIQANFSLEAVADQYTAVCRAMINP